MIKSMTGYGSATGVSGKLRITIELKSVNNRFLDCSIRIPRDYMATEEKLKSRIQSAISRGKVDVFVSVDSSQADNAEVTLNEPVADSYMDVLRTISERYGIPNDVNALSFTRLPEVISIQEHSVDADTIAADMTEILSSALMGFTEMRLREGEKLRDDLSSRIMEIERLTGLVEERSPQLVEEYRAKLQARMMEVLQTTAIDEARILTEAAIFADRVAVAEETVRLRSHISQFRNIMQSSEPVGRKLDFLVQELNREANTIGSKANDSDMAGIVVNLKSEIEKVREQIQNIE